MKNKKGFTLIELLAVIVILAIIALIATPIILNMIENAKKGAAIDSAYGYIDAIEYNNSLAEFNKNYKKIEDGSYSDFEKLGDVKVKGKVPDYIEYTILKGKVTKAGMCINNINIDYINNKAQKSETDYCKFATVKSITINNQVTSIESGKTLQLDITIVPSDVKPSYESSDESVATVSKTGLIEPKKYGKTTITVRAGVKVEKFELDVIKSGPTSEEPDTTKTKGLVKIVYLDPTDLTKTCNATNSKSTTGTKTGCMKWYAYKDDGTNYTMILDHNTTPLVAYNSKGSNTQMKEVADSLTNDIADWNNEIKSTARLITANEVAQITRNNTFDETKTSSSGYFFFETNANAKPTSYAGIYSWLYENTSGCKSAKCNVEDNNEYQYGTSGSTSYIYGYWTSTPMFGSNKIAWFVGRVGCLHNDHSVEYANYRGVRPVITIEKSIIQ